jgi:hypothetical protein
MAAIEFVDRPRLGTRWHVLDVMKKGVCPLPSYSTRYRKAKASKGLTGSFGDRSWPRKTII